MTDRMPTGDAPTHGVHVIPDEIPEGVVPPSTSMHPSAPGGNLRERLANTLHCPVCGVEPGEHCLRAREDNRQPHMTRAQAADTLLPAVMAAVGAAVAEEQQRADDRRTELLEERDQALHDLAEAERQRDEDLTALPDLIRVAAHVSRGRSFADVEPYPDALAREALGALDDATIRAALDQPEETR